MAKFHCTRYPQLRVLLPEGGSVKFVDGEVDVKDAAAQKVLREHKLVKRGPLPGNDDEADSDVAPGDTAADGSTPTDAAAAKEAAASGDSK